MTEFKRENKYLVIKRSDIDNYLSERDKDALMALVENIGLEKCPNTIFPVEPNSYVVVNEDEPYAEQVWELIKSHSEEL